MEQAVGVERIARLRLVEVEGQKKLQASCLTKIAEARGATPAQVTLAWMLKRSPAMLPIPGTLSLEHLRENLAAPEMELTEEEYEALA